MQLSVNLTVVEVVEAWSKLRTFGGFSNDHDFAKHLLASEERRQNLQPDFSLLFPEKDGATAAAIKQEVVDVECNFDDVTKDDVTFLAANDDQRYTCGLCWRDFIGRWDYDSHMEAGHDTFDCRECPEKFELRSYLHIHLKENHPEVLKNMAKKPDIGDIYCSICGQKYTNRKGLKVHVQLVHSSEMPHECPVCNERFKIRMYLRKHLNKRHPDYVEQMEEASTMACPNCKKKYRNKRLYQRHIQTCDDSKKYECEVCAEKFKTKKYLQTKHYKASHPEYYIRFLERQKDNWAEYSSKLKGKSGGVKQCRVCKELFKNTKELNKHRAELCEKETFKVMKNIDIPKDLICTECGHKAFSRYNYQNHVIAKHTEATPFECNICHQKFKIEFYLKNHVNRKHLQIKEFVCKHCGKAFYTKIHKEAHERNIHSGQKFRCQVCNKDYTSLEGLKDHSKMHSGQTFLCNYCGRGYRRRSALKAHELATHIQKKAFKCDQCTSAFSHAHGLVKHKRERHSGVPYERQFSCHLCEQKFYKQQHLNDHLNVHSGNRPYKCENCEKAFHTRVNLWNHRRLQHKDRQRPPIQHLVQLQHQQQQQQQQLAPAQHQETKTQHTQPQFHEQQQMQSLQQLHQMQQMPQLAHEQPILQQRLVQVHPLNTLQLPLPLDLDLGRRFHQVAVTQQGTMPGSAQRVHTQNYYQGQI